MKKQRPNGRFTGGWAGVDNAWEQEKLEPEKRSKMPQTPTRQVKRNYLTIDKQTRHALRLKAIKSGKE